jgi:hypothetical protein
VCTAGRITFRAMTDINVEPEVLRVTVPVETLVMDIDTHRHLLRVDGFMPLPAGARIELGSGAENNAADGIVVQTRVWAASSPKPLLVLDVKVVEPGEELP